MPSGVRQSVGGAAVADLVAVAAGGAADLSGSTVGTDTTDCRDGAQPARELGDDW